MVRIGAPTWPIWEETLMMEPFTPSSTMRFAAAWATK